VHQASDTVSDGAGPAPQPAAHRSGTAADQGKGDGAMKNGLLFVDSARNNRIAKKRGERDPWKISPPNDSVPESLQVFGRRRSKRTLKQLGGHVHV
jgi:hypothetical protein